LISASDKRSRDGYGPSERREVVMIRIFGALIVIQFVVVVLHDWLDIPGWNHGSQVQAAIGRRTLLIATIINGVFPATAVVFVLLYSASPRPSFVTSYWLIYCAVTVISAVAMWYVPYFFGASPEKKKLYSAMYARTRQTLPAHGDNPRPNLLHVFFHLLFVATLGLAIALEFAG
jgi:hypothetical protein